MSREYLTVREVSELLDISVSAIYNGTARNTAYPFPIKPIRIGRRVRFSKKKIEEFIEQMHSEDR